jgi:hypothetical protein
LALALYLSVDHAVDRDLAREFLDQATDLDYGLGGRHVRT